MSAKAPKASGRAKASTSRRGRKQEPLQVNLSVAVRFGEDEDDQVILMEDRELRMVGSIFRYRDKIARFMVTGLFRAAMLQPKVASRLFPLINRRNSKS